MKRLAWIITLTAGIACAGSAFADPTAEAACEASGGVWNAATNSCD